MKSKNEKTKAILAIIFVASIAVMIGMVSYAFFTTDIGENTNQELVLKAGTMQMKFSDNDAGINASLNFGESVTKEFILENTGTLDTKAKITFTNMINTYLAKSLTYKLEYKTSEESTNYIVAQDTKNVPRSEVSSTQTVANNLELPIGAKYYYRLTITLENLADEDQTDDINAIFTTTFGIEEASDPAEKTLKALGVMPNKQETGVPNFANPAITDEGVYALVDDYGTSYYYRGAVENNYIKYGQNKSGQDMWWRIIRINGDGSLRIIYDGTKGYANGTGNNARYAITSQPWHTQYTDAKYVGWMYGGPQGSVSTSKEQAQTNETNSDAKTAVDTWYKVNIVDTGYAENVVDRVFCNDRSTPGKVQTGWSSDTGLGYAKNATAYGAYARLTRDRITPKFICENKNDAFTVDDIENGNGDLTYPVGLITADEMVTAGGKYGTVNKSYYLYKSSSYYVWSLSPYHVASNGDVAVFGVDANGYLHYGYAHYTSSALAPVINLSAEYASILIGDGSITDPYRDPSDTM